MSDVILKTSDSNINPLRESGPFYLNFCHANQVSRQVIVDQLRDNYSIVIPRDYNSIVLIDEQPRDGYSIRVELRFPMYDQAFDTKLRMINSDNVLMEMMKHQMMCFRINPNSVGDFPVFNDPTLSHYASVIHEARLGQETGRIDLGYDYDDRGPGPYYLTFSSYDLMSEQDILFDLARDYNIGPPVDFDSIASIQDDGDFIRVELRFHTFQQAKQTELAMTDADDDVMTMVRSQMMGFHRNNLRARDFPILNNAQLSYYRTLDHDIVQGWEEDSSDDDRESSGDDGGQVQQEETRPTDIVRTFDDFSKDRQGFWFKPSDEVDGWGRRRQHLSMIRHESSLDESYTEEQEDACLWEWNNKEKHIDRLQILALDKARDNISQIDFESLSGPVKTAVNSELISSALFASDVVHRRTRKQDLSCNRFVEDAKRRGNISL